MFKKIQQVIQLIDFSSIPKERIDILEHMVHVLQRQKSNGERLSFNFICTHNSRRSQFGQVWAEVAASFYGISITAFSGGVEITSCDFRTIQSLKRFGFHVAKSEERSENPVFFVQWATESKAIRLFSKLYNHPLNPQLNFVALMMCNEADENCPVVLGAQERIALLYEDPKLYDDSPLEHAAYDQRSFQIATEMFYVFSKIK